MDFINDFLRSQPDEGTALYVLMGTIGQALMTALLIFYLIRMRVRWLDALKAVAIAYISWQFCGYAHDFLLWYQTGFDPNLYSTNAANLAVAFTLLPVVAWLCAKTFNTATAFAGDVAALTLLGYHIPGRSGCLFTGCCYGFPCDWGWYSHEAASDAVHNAINQGTPLPEADALYTCFPTSLVESLFTLGILIFILVRICRKGYTPDGKNLPYFLLIYGICRFFSEMTRESTRDQWLFWRISDIHFHMLAMALVGGWMLYAILKREKAAVSVETEPSLPTLSGQRK